MRQTRAMQPVQANHFLHGARPIPAGDFGEQIIIAGYGKLIGNSAYFLNYRAAQQDGTHGNETGGPKQFAEDVAFRQRTKLVCGIEVPLFAVGRKGDGSSVNNAEVFPPIAVDYRHLALQLIWKPDVVLIKKSEPWPARLPNGQLPRAPQACGFRREEITNAAVAVAGYNASAVIGGAVVP